MRKRITCVYAYIRFDMYCTRIVLVIFLTETMYGGSAYCPAVMESGNESNHIMKS